MNTKVVLRIHFPKIQFRKIPVRFSTDLWIGYVDKGDIFHLGKVTSVHQETPEKVVMRLEVRKDETPTWYLSGIIRSAKQNQVCILRKSRVLCDGGRITEASNLQEVDPSKIVEPLEAWLEAEKNL